MNRSTTPETLTKEVRAWLTTGAASPEDTLRHLDSIGVDWYLTEHGDVMIRYWQLGAEGFVSPERVARIQEGRRRPPHSEALEWVSAHLPTLRANYPERWIAVVDGRVLADAPGLPDLLVAVRDLGGENPFVTQIPAEPMIWNTLYAGLMPDYAG